MCLNPLWRCAVPSYVVHSMYLSKDILKKYKNGGFVFSPNDFVTFEFLNQFFPKYAPDTKEIICGQCIECRIRKAQEDSQRCMAEAQTSEHDCYFLTLTYDDEHLPEPILSFPYHDVPGEVHDKPVLCSPLKKKDFQDWIKRFRMQLERKQGFKGVRYFYCGEYGSQSNRPHMHVLLFNVDLPDLEVAFTRSLTSGKDIKYFQSKFVSDSWGQGFVSISPLTWENIAYTCRYVMKKKTGKHSEAYLKKCFEAQVQPVPYEFTNRSTKPALGRAYYEEHKDFIHEFDKVLMPNGKELKPAKYYDKLYDLEDPEAMAAIKLLRERKIAEAKLSRNLNGSISEEESRRKRARAH